MNPLERTSSDLTLTASDISGSIPLNSSQGQLRFIIRIRSLNFGSNFYHLLWCCYLFLTTSMPHDANTFNVCGEMMSGSQDCFLLKLAHFNLSATNCQLVADQLPINHRPVAEDFRAKAFMKLIGDGSAPYQRLLENLCNYSAIEISRD